MSVEMENEDDVVEMDEADNIDEELAMKVAIQQQMLEQEKQKEALGYQQSLLLKQQQQLTQPSLPAISQSSLAAPVTITQTEPPPHESVDTAQAILSAPHPAVSQPIRIEMPPVEQLTQHIPELPQVIPAPPQVIPAPPQPIPGPPLAIPGPPLAITGPPQAIPGPPQAIPGPPQAIPGPPQAIPGPPQAIPGPPQAIPAPPQDILAPSQANTLPSPQVAAKMISGPPQTMQGHLQPPHVLQMSQAMAGVHLQPPALLPSSASILQSPAPMGRQPAAEQPKNIPISPHSLPPPPQPTALLPTPTPHQSLPAPAVMTVLARQPGPLHQSDMMMKARQQQQMLDAEKQREAQQKLMQQQHLALFEAQRTEQHKRMLLESQQLHHSSPSQTSAQQSIGHPHVPAGMGASPFHLPTSMQQGPPMRIAHQNGRVFPHMNQRLQSHQVLGPPSSSHGNIMIPPGHGSSRVGMRPLQHMPPSMPLHGVPRSATPQIPSTHLSIEHHGDENRAHLSSVHLMDQDMRRVGVHPSEQDMSHGFATERDIQMAGRHENQMRRVNLSANDHNVRRPGIFDHDIHVNAIDLDMRKGPRDLDMAGEIGSHASVSTGVVLPTPLSQGQNLMNGKSIIHGLAPPAMTSGYSLHNYSLRGNNSLANMAPKTQQFAGSFGPKEIRLPQALEKVLEFKLVREQEIGMSEDVAENGPESQAAIELDDDDRDVENFVQDGNVDEKVSTAEERTKTVKKTAKETKNKKKKKKKKALKNRLHQQNGSLVESEKTMEPEVYVEYVPEQLELDPLNPHYFTFSKIFEAFQHNDSVSRYSEQIKETEKVKDRQEVRVVEKVVEKVPVKVNEADDDSDDDMEQAEQGDENKISKKKMKKLTRLSVAQLKQLVSRPDVVEMHDVTAKDPPLLVHLKATRNTVPVPRHWCYKRKYLQGKRGIEKSPFELPDFIRATGIEDMRAALQEKEDQKNLKSKMREKVRPKLGKIDIDYQKLHDAFFRFQTRPKMTIHGDLYYESKEFEIRLKEKKPGTLTGDLRLALGMPVGVNADRIPPPWLIAMQRYGPPPSYPNLKVPGLNAPIPEGCAFGYHAGGWGKPPVDEVGKPLYGDVFGTLGAGFQGMEELDVMDQSHWGELESESESEEESEDEDDDKDDTGLVTPAEGLVTPSGLTSIPIGVETPDMIELRKRRIEDAMDQGGDTPSLFTVLPEKKTAVGVAMMGSSHIYDVSGVPPGSKKAGEKAGTAEGVEVTLDPEELDLDTAAMQAKYDETLREQQSQLEKEDLSDMVAAHTAKQRKRKKQQAESGAKSTKRYKDFKF